jgi:hypothetical protein
MVHVELVVNTALIVISTVISYLLSDGSAAITNRITHIVLSASVLVLQQFMSTSVHLYGYNNFNYFWFIQQHLQLLRLYGVEC